MGREIRRVPKDWEHPQHERCPHLGGINGHNEYRKPGEYIYGKCFRPLYDADYETTRKEWIDGLAAWLNGTHEDFQAELDYWEYYGNPPDREDYRPAWTEEEAIYYQIYETVSEGTPVSPVFESLEILSNWLIAQGYSEKAALSFAKSGWVPSAMFSPATGFVSGIDIAGLDDDHNKEKLDLADG